MKKTFYLFLLLAFGSQAQTIDYLGNNPKWRQLKVSNNEPCMVYHNFVYRVEGDSVVGPYTYKKVYKTGEITKVPMMMGGTCPPTETYSYFFILMRQDAKRLYVHDGNLDTLLYDFDLNIGDTLPLTYNNLANDVIVTSIDSTLIDGDYRRVFNLEAASPLAASSLIEGVGTDKGLLEQLTLSFSYYELRCFEYNGQSYLVGDAGCNFNVGIDEKTNLNTDLVVYPVPSDKEVIVKFSSEQQIEKVSAVDALGRTNILKFNTKNENEVFVDVENLSGGVYILMLMDSDGEEMKVRILVE